jgi:hypothetical protein
MITILENSGLRHPVLALAKLCMKRKRRQKKQQPFKQIIDCSVPNGFVCVLRMCIAESPLMSSHRKEFPDVCPEYQCGCLVLREDDVINGCSELLRQDWQRERNEDHSCRTKGARVSLRLNSLEELILRRDDASRAKARRQISL